MSADLTAATIIASFNLAVGIGQIRREGDRFFFPSETDKSEPEHCVDVVGAYLYCTCRGFVEKQRLNCKHTERVRKYMNATQERALVPGGPTQLPEVWRSPLDLERRLVDLAQERNIIQNFIKEAMVKGEDYGVIPGTKLPSLYKAGAEKLCEMYGLYPKIVDKHEISDDETGHCRYVIVVGLFDRGTGIQVAECPGECSTRESKYMYRWVYSDKLPRDFNPAGLKSESGGSGERRWTRYRLLNDDLWSLWNTVLKMAFKRAFVGATHQATRSSGIFTLTEQQLDEQALRGEYRFLDEDDEDPLDGDVPSEAPPAAQEPAQPPPAPAPVQDTTPAPAAPRATRTQAQRPAPPVGEERPAPADTEHAGVAMNLFWKAIRAHTKDNDAVIAASQERFGKVPAELDAQGRNDLIERFSTGFWPGEGEKAPAEHEPDPYYNSSGVLLCKKCQVEIDEDTGKHK